MDASTPPKTQKPSCSSHSEHDPHLQAGVNKYQTNKEERTSLMLAARNNQPQCLIKLLEQAVEVCVDVADSHGETALIHSCRSGSLECLNALIKAGADINLANSDGTSPLMVAAARGHKDCVFALIGCGAKVNAVDTSGRTPLIMSLLSEQEDCAKILLEAGCSVNCVSKDGMTALMAAAKMESSFFLKQLIDLGAEVVNCDCKGNNALFYAAKHHNWENMKILLQAGSDVKQKNDKEETVLMVAIKSNDTRAKFDSSVKSLIDAGVDINDQDKKGRTALMIAIGHKYNEEFIQNLMSTGADINLTDNNDETALMKAVAALPSHYFGMDDINDDDSSSDDIREETTVSQLMALTDNINRCDITGRTALMFASAECNDLFARRLIEAGADVNMRDFSGRTALMHAIISVKDEITNKYVVGDFCELLIKKGADVNVQDDDGMTALMFAARNNVRGPVSNLVTNKSDLELTDKTGRSALVYALEQFSSVSNIDVFWLLLDSGANPVLNEEFRPMIEKLTHLKSCTCYFMCVKMNCILRFFVSNGIIELNLKLRCWPSRTEESVTMPSSLTLVLETGRNELNNGAERYLMSNCCVSTNDLKQLRRRDFTDKLDNKFVNFIKKATSNPWPLVKLAFIAVSSAIGLSGDRKGRIQETGLPWPIHECLMFQRPVSLIPVHHWEDIPLCFNPIEYESLPAPYPLLYNWPFGHRIVDCDCEKCKGKYQNFQ